MIVIILKWNTVSKRKMLLVKRVFIINATFDFIQDW